MPTPEQILSGLREIANSWQVLAAFWHLYGLALAVVLIAGGRPPKRLAGVLLALPLFSVSTVAWLSHNPFNGAVFAALALLVVVISLRLPREEVRVAPPWATVAGILMVIFGLVYPHFLETSTFVTYLYAAPVGLIPCPTLSLVIGLALVADGLGARTLPLVLGFSGIFYGATGALQLGVSLDWVLLVGSLVIVIVAMRRTKAAEASAVPPAPQTGRPGSPA